VSRLLAVLVEQSVEVGRRPREEASEVAVHFEGSVLLDQEVRRVGGTNTVFWPSCRPADRGMPAGETAGEVDEPAAARPEGELRLRPSRQTFSE